MLTKKKQQESLLISKHIFISFELQNLVRKSIRRNTESLPITRFILYKTSKQQLNYPYISKQRLYCFISFRNRVPNSRLNLCRFFLAKHGDNLNLSRLIP